MKTLPMIAALVPLVAACGSATGANSQALETECTYELPAGADAAQLQRAVNAALENKFDACVGSVTGMAARNVALQRVDLVTAAGQQRFSLVFSVSTQLDATHTQLEGSNQQVDSAHNQLAAMQHQLAAMQVRVR